tara:strand:+ start:543 stop:722 length:180 start_codon:yes stop_codon:yes gene_type:complete
MATKTTTFTKRQLELILYASELAIDGRNYKDANGLESIVVKLRKAGVRNDTRIDNSDNR